MASDVHHQPNAPLLAATDPPPTTVVNPHGRSRFLFIGDHAGNVIPSRLGDLGLPPVELTRHIAWDIGVAGLGERLADAMDATFIRQTYSRLVVDCNRRPDADDAMPPVSDATIVPGNTYVSADARAARLEEIFEPYHRTIERQIAQRCAAGRAPMVISLHSFTPALANGVLRPWHVGVLHDAGDASFARALLTGLRRDGDIVVGDNEPYRMDTIDYTVPRHCYPSRLAYAELEIRQDLLGDDEGRTFWADRLAKELTLLGTAI